MAGVAGAPDARRDPTGARGDAVSRRRHGLVSAPSAARENRPLSRGRRVRGRGASRAGLSAVAARSGGRAGHRSRDRGVSAARPLGCRRQVELLGPALSGASLPERARAGAELFRELREFAGRADSARLLSSDQPGPLRSDVSGLRSEEHTSELQSLTNLVCRLLLEKKTRPSDQLRTYVTSRSSASL